MSYLSLVQLAHLRRGQHGVLGSSLMRTSTYEVARVVGRRALRTGIHLGGLD